MKLKPGPLEVRSPYNGDPLGCVNIASPSDVKDAVDRARNYYLEESKTWTPFERFTLLQDVHRLVGERAEEFARLITLETGKTIRDSQNEVQRALSTLQYCAESSKRIHGKVMPCDITKTTTGKTAYIHRVPLGVIAAITPYNFPLNTVLHKIAPAIAAGNAVVLKPSPKAPLSAELLCDVFKEAGASQGMLELIHGGADVAELLISNPDVRMVTFTGSVIAGQSIASKVGIKKLTLELGGNDALILCEDGDLDLAVKAAIEHGLGTCGQRCTAVKRIYAHKSLAFMFQQRLLEAVSRLRIGDPLDPKTDLGPMIDEAAAVVVDEKVKDACDQGARLLYSGQREGAIMPPIVIDLVSEDSVLIKDETFGPVLPLLEFERIEEVVEKVNGTEYGLQAGVFTDSIDAAKMMMDRLDVGTVIINDGPGFRVDSLPFGGVKNSGLGREGIAAAIIEMTEEKVLVM